VAADSYRLPFLLKLLAIAELTHFANFRCDVAFGELLHTRMARCAALFTAVFASIGEDTRTRGLFIVYLWTQALNDTFREERSLISQRPS
jgi:hypothetical protein